MYRFGHTIGFGKIAANIAASADPWCFAIRRRGHGEHKFCKQRSHASGTKRMNNDAWFCVNREVHQSAESSVAGNHPMHALPIHSKKWRQI
mmetsp:Transcript_18714/g.52255  ORF Transcript_18714/g.52255 Transcript_18714/m.52255 type:complete len:91 (+) Transcript_18714:97-369(+)